MFCYLTSSRLTGLRSAADSQLLRKPTLMLSNLNRSVKQALTPAASERQATHEIGSSLARLASVATNREEQPAQPTVAPQRPVTVAKAAAETQRYGGEFKISGTPTFKLNGGDVNTNSWAGLEPILQRAGAR